ncbi:MAG: hypothetical protein H6R10_2546 [Rhodocyclaceae bacterium]|nr:hypothetical protein [Rhodocyclaceae bacterium]
MKRNFILSASAVAIAMALGGAVPSLAQESPGETVTPPQLNPSYETQQPLETPAPAPRGVDEGVTQPQGVQGPVRSDESAQYPQDTSRYGTYSHRPTGNAGYDGFLRWQETNSNTP